MQLSSHVEWAIHCCVVLAGLGPDDRLSTKTLADFHGVPKEYLSKALQALSAAKIVEGTLGPSGGYRLARTPRHITLLAIVESVEGRESSFRCQEIRGNNPCLKRGEKPTGVCAIARAMYRADEAWRKELRSVTIEDIKAQVVHDVPADQLARSAEWLARR
jgi:Rrf2 family protein